MFVLARYRSFLGNTQQQRSMTQMLDFDNAKKGRHAIHTFKVAERPVSAGGVKPVKPSRDDFVCHSEIHLHEPCPVWRKLLWR